MPITFSVVGWSGSGKSTLIVRLIERFKAGNKKVMVVKHVPHEYRLEPAAKDSFKFLQAGSDEVLLAAREEILSMQRNDRQGKIFDLIAEKSAQYDIILLEGLHRPGIPLIEVFDPHKNPAPKFPLAQLSALVTGCPGYESGGIPCFHIGDIPGLARFMEDYYG